MIWALKMASWFLCQTMQGTSRANIAMDSRFWLAAYLVWLFDSHFSLVHFSRLKYILARQILHFSPLLLTMPDKVWPLKGGSVIQFFFFFLIHCLLLFLLLQICLQNDDLFEDDDANHSSILLRHCDPCNNCDWSSAKARYEIYCTIAASSR